MKRFAGKDGAIGRLRRVIDLVIFRARAVWIERHVGNRR